MKKLPSKYTLSRGNTVSQFNINEFYFVIMVTLENDVPVEMMSQMLRHKCIRTTLIYAKATQQNVSNNMRALQDRLSTPGVGLRQTI